jgi:hypothetical protein
MIGEKPIAVKYNPLTMVLIIGGPMKSYGLINKFLDFYFKAKNIDNTEIINSKCKFTIENYRRKDFNDAIESLDAEGIIGEDVSSLGRLFR